ncbi:MAG: glycosyltransferase [Gracilibacteraceae bacterium]|jgi:glycosyltransferase involved in cell wall biosynthesis|nr:glycosyltransferase [Gracilibacteraceae bacterium]
MKLCRVPCHYEQIDAALLRERLASLARARVVIYGAGNFGKLVFNYLTQNGAEIECFCDQAEEKQAGAYCGKPVISLAALGRDWKDAVVLIAVYGRQAEIGRTLRELGFAGASVISALKNVAHTLLIPPEALPALCAGQGLDIVCAEPARVNFPAGHKPSITVYSRIYNTPEAYLRRAVESVLRQTFTDFNFLIVDNGSTDGSAKILREYAAKDGRITVVTLSANYWETNERSEEDSANEAKIYHLFTGKYTCYLDSDDYYEPDFLDLTFALAEKFGADIVTGASVDYRETDLSVIKVRPDPVETLVYHGIREIIEMICDYGIYYAMLWGKLYKTSVFLDWRAWATPEEMGDWFDVYHSYYAYLSSSTVVFMDKLIHCRTQRYISATYTLSPATKLVQRNIYVYKRLCQILVDNDMSTAKNLSAIEWRLFDMGLGFDIELLERVRDTHPHYVTETVRAVLSDELMESRKTAARIRQAVERLRRLAAEAEKQTAKGINI